MRIFVSCPDRILQILLVQLLGVGPAPQCDSCSMPAKCLSRLSAIVVRDTRDNYLIDLRDLYLWRDNLRGCVVTVRAAIV